MLRKYAKLRIVPDRLLVIYQTLADTLIIKRQRQPPKTVLSAATITIRRFAHKATIVTGLLLVAGCAPEAEVVNELKQKPYFDLPALVQQQLYWLDSLNPPVVLEARIGQQTESETMRKDSASWAETLQLFQQTDINRPVLQGEYEESDSVAADQNLQVKTYRYKQAKSAEIPYLKVYYRDSLANVYRIETAFQEDNVLYSTYRNMWMTFAPYQGQPRLVAFETTGKQKMMLRDSVTYISRGELQYD